MKKYQGWNSSGLNTLTEDLYQSSNFRLNFYNIMLKKVSLESHQWENIPVIRNIRTTPTALSCYFQESACLYSALFKKKKKQESHLFTCCPQPHRGLGASRQAMGLPCSELPVEPSECGMGTSGAGSCRLWSGFPWFFRAHCLSSPACGTSTI